MKKLTLIITCALQVFGGYSYANLACLYKVEQSPFATYIAQKVGDILTVCVHEIAETKDNGHSNLDKTDTISAELEKLFIPKITTK